MRSTTIPRISPSLRHFLRQIAYGGHYEPTAAAGCQRTLTRTALRCEGSARSLSSCSTRTTPLQSSTKASKYEPAVNIRPYTNRPVLSSRQAPGRNLPAARCFNNSTTSYASMFSRKPPDKEPKKSGSSASSRYLDPVSENSILGRSFTLQNHGDVMLRCTEFDQEGKVKATSRAFKKMELCTQHGLLPRDLRKLESSVIVPHILVRPNSLLVNLLHIRALIKADAVLLFDVYGSTDSHTQSVFMYDLQGKLSSGNSKAMGGLPYEMRALESILISVTAALEAEMKILQDSVVKVLSELEEDIDRDKLRHLLIYSKKLSTFEQKAKLIRGAIDEILEADDDLANMYLTEKMQGIDRPAEDHSEVEMLLESYFLVTDEIVQITGNLVSNIRNTEDIVNIILDANRNSLMLLDLKFSIGTLGIGSGAFVAALYGMNLKNFMEESNLAFVGVSVWAFLFSAIICVYGLHKLRRTQRLTMWGEGGKGRKWWRSTNPNERARSTAVTTAESIVSKIPAPGVVMPQHRVPQPIPPIAVPTALGGLELVNGPAKKP